jgi:hypothetical protein
MTKQFLQKRWLWIIYRVLFGIITVRRNCAFVLPSETFFFYNQVVMIFCINQGQWPVAYIFTSASIVFNTVIIVLLWFYAIEKHSFSISFIFFILAAKFMTDILGYSYEWNTIRALSYQSRSLAQLAAVNLILWQSPFYLAMGDYVVQKIRNEEK